MLNKSTVQLMALGLVGSFAATAAAQDSGALIDALVRKGVLKDQEAEQIRSQLSKDFAANTPAGKLNLSSSVKELKLSGDVRVRYTNQNVGSNIQTGLTGATTQVETRDSRFRLRLRVNADYKLNDDVTAGFGLQTQSKNDSGNVTMSKDSASGNGYFENYSVFINKAYIGWTPVAGVNLTGGKFTNPIYTTDLVYDPDINPAGFAERIDFHKFLELGGLELSLVGLQGSVSDQTESSASTRAATDGWIFHTQLIAAADIAEGVKLTVAPGYYCTNDGTGQSATAGGGETNAVLAVSQLKGLKIITAPGDVSFKLFGKPSKVMWDFAYNNDAAGRIAAYNASAGTTSTTAAITAAQFTAGAATTLPVTTTTTGATSQANVDSLTPAYNPTGTDKLAWLAGFQFGENKKKGDWSLLANWRVVGSAAVDSSINDSDWAVSRTNMQGPKGSFTYNVGDAFTIAASYYLGNNIRKELNVSPANGNSIRVLQIDASVKF
jgi:polyhydroxyalkanoate synthesis regulator phasin